MKKIAFFILAFAPAFSSFSLLSAQNPQDAAAIKSMCGCYEVNFLYTETFSPDSSYKKHDDYQTGGLEWVELVSDEKQKIVLQHLLIAGKDEKGEAQIIKHWRQDWQYQNTDFYQYHKDNIWKFVSLPKAKVKGQWTQKVYQVDDSPRYEGSATWTHADGRHYWENTTDSPLPRREFTHRSDYNVLRRRNRHEITAYGWLHEQDNTKVLRSDSDKTIAEEKGWNTYTKVDNSRCLAAQNWWKTNKDFWAVARQEWDSIFARRKDLILAKTVAEKPLFMHLFPLQTTQSNEIKGIIEQFLK